MFSQFKEVARDYKSRNDKKQIDTNPPFRSKPANCQCFRGRPEPIGMSKNYQYDGNRAKRFDVTNNLSTVKFSRAHFAFSVLSSGSAHR